jgi:undecaprenyl-diphosphatase
MDWWQAIVLGLVEGLTEYLPVSSTGHLILAQRAMGIGESEAASAYAICIQAGAIVAVLGLYRRRFFQMSMVLYRQPRCVPAEHKRLLANIIIAFLPALVFGLLLNKTIKAHLFGLWPVVAAWFVGGLAILGVTWWKGREVRGARPGASVNGGTQRSLEDPTLPQPLPRREASSLEQMTWQMALIIGLAQCVAMWPGTSRSLATIVAGLLVGLRVSAAVEFSFLLGVMTLGAATVYDGYKHGGIMLQSYGLVALMLGFLFAFISAVLAVKWMVAYLQRHGLYIFGWYRVALAAVVAAMILAGGLRA